MTATEINFLQTKVTLSSGYNFTVSGKISFNPGDCILILGENGSGKTTILTLLQSIYEGEERGSILEIDWSRIQPLPIKSRIAHVFQEPRENFISRCSADEIILPFLSADFPADELVKRLARFVDAADIHRQNLLRRPIDLLSAGEQQRIAVCAALAPNPTIMLWDEAFARIDDKTAAQFDLLMKKDTLAQTVLFAATHRPRRFARLFPKRITSVVFIVKNGNKFVLEQQPFQLGMQLPGQATDEELNFRLRILWDKYLDKQLLAPDMLFFNNGFRIFGSADEHIFDVSEFDMYARGLATSLAPLQQGSVTRRLNFVVGRNGSGKTLFLRFLAGHFPINPIWPSLCKLYVSANMSKPLFGSPAQLRKAGLSVYLPGEPFRWLTEDTVGQELRFYHHAGSLSKRLALLKKYKIFEQTNPDHLSYGERKLVCLMSLPEQMDVVCLDEPFADMSATLIRETEEFIDQMVATSKWKSVLISHASDLA
jgi:energy-coupling factor transporter ATP-binding protein EcfA2